MRGPQVILGVTAVLFVGFGIAFLWIPGDLMAHVGIILGHGTATAEIRALYGGMNLGIGLFLLSCLKQPQRLRIGLEASALLLAAIATCRVLGIVAAGGDVLNIIYLFFGLEAAGAALNLWALRLVGRS